MAPQSDFMYRKEFRQEKDLWPKPFFVRWRDQVESRMTLSQSSWPGLREESWRTNDPPTAPPRDHQGSMRGRHKGTTPPGRLMLPQIWSKLCWIIWRTKYFSTGFFWFFFDQPNCWSFENFICFWHFDYSDSSDVLTKLICLVMGMHSRPQLCTPVQLLPTTRYVRVC